MPNIHIEQGIHPHNPQGWTDNLVCVLWAFCSKLISWLPLLSNCTAYIHSQCSALVHFVARSCTIWMDSCCICLLANGHSSRSGFLFFQSTPLVAHFQNFNQLALLSQLMQFSFLKVCLSGLWMRCLVWHVHLHLFGSQTQYFAVP